MKPAAGAELARLTLDALKTTMAAKAGPAGSGRLAAPQNLTLQGVEVPPPPPPLTKGQLEAIALVEANLLEMNQTMIGIGEILRKARLGLGHANVEQMRAQVGLLWRQLEVIQIERGNLQV